MAVIRDQVPAFTTSVPVIVVGAGAAGVLAALAARDFGAKVLVLDRDYVASRRNGKFVRHDPGGRHARAGSA